MKKISRNFYMQTVTIFVKIYTTAKCLFLNWGNCRECRDNFQSAWDHNFLLNRLTESVRYNYLISLILSARKTWIIANEPAATSVCLTYIYNKA